jgi:hypothetical protein
MLQRDRKFFLVAELGKVVKECEGMTQVAGVTVIRLQNGLKGCRWRDVERRMSEVAS